MDSVTAKTSPTLSSERLFSPPGGGAGLFNKGGETKKAGGPQRPARPLALTQSQPPGDVGRVAPGRSQASRPADAAAWATRTLSPGGCAHPSVGIGMLGVRTA